MAILIRTKHGKWEKVGESPFKDEAHLQQMLYESPELIRTSGEEKPPWVFIKEAGLPGSGSTDLLGVDCDGEIYIVECKLADNPDIRRKVIGQILEYAAFLWKENYENFSDRFFQKEKKALEELLGNKVSDDPALEDFQAKVEQNLDSGRFHLIVVVDKMRDELQRIVDYVQARQAGFHIEVLELALFKEGDTEVLVPRMHSGHVEPLPPPKSLTIDQIFQESEKQGTRTQLVGLVREWEKLGNIVEPAGRGIRFRAQIGDRNRTIFRTSTVHWVYMRFGLLPERGVPPQLVKHYREEVAKLHGFDRQKVLERPYPQAALTDLSEEDITAIARVNQEFVEQWQNWLRQQGS